MPTNKKAHYRITLGDAISAHEVAISEFGGRSGILDIGRLEAALMRPYVGYHRPIYRKAAALIEALTANHAFVDGNKRTALMLLHLLLVQSGYTLHQTST